MKNNFSLLFLLAFGTAFSQAQENGIPDTIPSLGEITIKGFEAGRQRIAVPASVTVLRERDMQRFSNTSLVPVVNTVPGVRMEERSPGSYRLSMRGSLLRSPFGIRNIKVYWNDFILTDAGGNTYLNLVDFNSVGQMELLKGPAGSIYGAGTGGVVVLQSPSFLNNNIEPEKKHEFDVRLTAGSYGQFSESIRWQSGTKNVRWQLIQGHYQSDGYRSNSRMRRDMIQGNLVAQTGERNRIEALLLLSDLAYRTPGGLNLAQKNADPTQSRPATPVLPSAAEQKAGIYNKTLMVGLSNVFMFSEKWQNVSSLTTALTGFENPFISNYEKRKENNLGVRTKFVYSSPIGKVHLRWIIGLEFQSGFYTIDSTGNNKGVPDNNLVRDKVRSIQQFLFTQGELQLTRQISFQAGISINDFRFRFQRTIGQPETDRIPASFKAQVVPRIAFLYRFTENMALHASTSKGFSPPSLAEIRPSAGGFSLGLQAEHGWNHEIGVKGSAFSRRIQFDLAMFRFNLKDAIVRRTNAAGSEYFINAGGTKQNGIELFAEGYPVRRPGHSALSQIRLWSSVTLNDFTFSDYTVNLTSYSGNKLTGVPRKVILAGLDIEFLRNFYIQTTFNHADKIPLTDANDEFADSYRLWQSRIGWRKMLRSVRLEVFFAVDNIGNEKYSLGNDLNAFGRRFYNPAPERNYSGGIMLKF